MRLRQSRPLAPSRQSSFQETFFTWLRCGNEAAGERPTGSSYSSDVQKQHSLFRSSSGIQETFHRNRAGGESRQPVQGRAATGHAPKHAQPHHAGTQDRCSPLARWRQASSTQRSSRPRAGEKTSPLTQHRSPAFRNKKGGPKRGHPSAFLTGFPLVRRWLLVDRWLFRGRLHDQGPVVHRHHKWLGHEGHRRPFKL